MQTSSIPSFILVHMTFMFSAKAHSKIENLYIDSVLVELYFGLLVLLYLDIAHKGRYYIAQGNTYLPLFLETLVLHLQLVLLLFGSALGCQGVEIEFVLRCIADAFDVVFNFRLVIFGHTPKVLNGLK